MTPYPFGGITGWMKTGAAINDGKEKEDDMKNKKSFLSLLALTLLSLILLAGCGEKKWPMQITVVNRTTYPISDIRISLASDEDWGANRIETTLEEGERADIDLGEFTEAELTNEGFNIQFYGEDGEPVNPDYDPQNPTFFDNGDYLILAPPDISVSMFMDTGYDAAEYDQKIMECYEQQDDGRGDLIPEEENESGDLIQESDAGDSGTVPVLMGGGLPFTNMENLETENYEDGTYYYEDITEDGLTIIVNTVFVKDADTDGKELENYLVGCALNLGDSDLYEVLSASQNADFTANFTYPVYIVEYTTGANEDTRKWSVFAMDTDLYTYLYGFCSTIDAEEDMEEIYQDIFSGLYLSDEK